ncbi:hypothetical protein SAMN04488598_15014 [Halanaerobium congolense]|uniref:Uncharacterized protein n=1 Tax=Halanaerobium congolense TaxID=54121 RepID=A0A1I0CS24_9FIRM|nr:hypothetical protein [Halanaerobium congolense]PTX14751.1 hypothetical protein C7953_2812 [Halanaerobium congolense]PTX14894.1 hypothetical protein C7953_2962 [Halanaerobium congolense]SDG13461.1 hypothetical protein SAMN04488598_15014 [Halanaerobium congolense]SET21868.1 hypothetical protein SAMN04515652_1428 [Halanaerobium congolense]SFP73720.1 hypothetical protein SAMN04488596_14814 [Halanaerobium congolense]
MTQIKDFAMMIAMDLEKVSPSTQITVTIITFIAVILMLQKTVEIYSNLFNQITSTNERRQRIDQLLEEVEREFYGYSKSDDDYRIK